MREWLNKPVPYKNVLVSYGVCFLLALGGVFLTLNLIAESKGRRDQSCTQSERKHLEDVKQLRRTYAYLVDPAKFGDRKGSDLYNVVLAQIERTERQARIDPAPKFCDEPGIGLPEPDPVLPTSPFAVPPSPKPDVTLPQK